MYGLLRAARGSWAILPRHHFFPSSRILQGRVLPQKQSALVPVFAAQGGWQQSSSGHARGYWQSFSLVVILSMVAFDLQLTVDCAPKTPLQTPIAARTRAHETAEPVTVVPIRALNNPQAIGPVQVKASAAKNAKLNAEGASNAYADYLWLKNPTNLENYIAEVKTRHPESASLSSPTSLVAQHYVVSRVAVHYLVQKEILARRGLKNAQDDPIA